MSKRKDDTTQKLALAAVIAIGAYLVTRPKNTLPPPPPPPFYQLPPPPPQNTPAWQTWTLNIINLYGAVAPLWQPGGPFYKQPITPQQAQQIQTGLSLSTYAWP